MVDEILLLHRLEHCDAGAENATAEATTINGEAAMSVEEAVQRLPLIGYIPMGTGNGLGYVIGCKAGSEPSTGTKRSLFSKLDRKQNKLERARQVMSRLKEVGDAVQNSQEMPKCSIVEMPLMRVTHPELANGHDPDDAGTDRGDDKGDLCFFAGAGFDSLMLHDFERIKAWSRSPATLGGVLPAFVREALSSVVGYGVALVTRTLPQTLRHRTHQIRVEVTTRDEDALWVDHRRGDFAEPAVMRAGKEAEGRRGAVGRAGGDATADDGPAAAAAAAPRRRKKHLIFAGTTGIIAASTTPYYGGGMRLFPYARLFPTRLQLRLGRISPWTGFLNIPKIFEGSYRETSERQFGCLDFVGKEFEVEVSSGRYEEYVRRRSERRREGGKRRSWLRPWAARVRDEEDEGDVNGQGSKAPIAKGFPFQHSGESMGVRERFKLRVVQEPVKFVSFLEPRVVVDD